MGVRSEIIAKYTSVPLHKLMIGANEFGTNGDKMRMERVFSLLYKEKLELAAKTAIIGSEKSNNDIISRLFKHAKIAIDNAKDAYYHYIYNHKSNTHPYLSELKSPTAKPIAHTIRAKGELPLMTKGPYSKEYSLPTGKMSRISGAIALLKREIEREEKPNETKNRALSSMQLKWVKRHLKNGRVKAALRLCKEQEDISKIGSIAEAKAWRRLYNAISGN